MNGLRTSSRCASVRGRAPLVRAPGASPVTFFGYECVLEPPYPTLPPRGGEGFQDAPCVRGPAPAARSGYVLLETVIATGLLIVGLAVIGAQIQDSDTAIRQMRLRLRAMTLARPPLAGLGLGVVEVE